MTTTAVSYSLTIDGSPATSDLLNAVQRIDVEDHAEMADMLRLKLAMAVKAGGSAWTLIDDRLFPRLANLKLSVTIGSGKAIPLISAYVVETSATFSNDPSDSTLTVVAMDPTVLMHLEEKVKPWPNMSDSDVASAVFGDAKYGFTPVVEATRWTSQENEHTLIQRGSDIQFLQQLADRNGYECFVEMNPSSGQVEGHFHPPRHDQEPQGTLTVNMGSATNVNAFKGRHDMLSPTTAQAVALDVEDASNQKGEAEDAQQKGLGKSEEKSEDRPRRVLLSQLGAAKAGETQRLAQAVVDRSAWAIVGEGELNTVAYGGVLRAKRPVLVRGAGRDFSGRYYIEKVLHSLTSSGTYTQKFTLRRNALGITGRERFQDERAPAA